MRNVGKDLEEFGKKVLAPLRSSPTADPHMLAEEKAKFLLQGDNLRKSLNPGSADRQHVLERGNDRGIRNLPLPLVKSMVVLIMVIVLVAGSSFSVYAAQDSLPGEPLYIVKSVSEDIRLSMTVSTQAKLNLTLDYTNRRVNEIQKLVKGGKSLPEQASARYQQELEDTLELAAQLNDQQLQLALNEIKAQAETQGMTMDELISRLPAQASPAIIHIQQRLQEQVQLSTIGEENLIEFRTQVRERAEHRQGPKHPDNSEEPGLSPFLVTASAEPVESDKSNEANQVTETPGHDNNGNGQGSINPENGNRNGTPTPTP